ncbi:hypothetical protein [Alicycliphilus denitrificans]|uniref:hypothetical protein n=1 Tax=Alicycliphilus denitrificans TaxID=179636 RepID=UPI0038504CD4
MRIAFAIGAVLSALMLSACASRIPVRTEGFKEAPDCQAIYEAPAQKGDAIAYPESDCWLRAVEERQAYDLLFIEFDDQGWIQGSSKVRDGRPDHLDQLFQQLNRLVEKHRQEGISLVLFIHGWHNDASANNDKLRDFRVMLRDFNDLETMNGGRRVVGLYVGWRGDSITLSGLKELTFWDRKNTAEKVAQGSVRELFARLGVLRYKTGARDSKRLRMLSIGHSFGGLIMYEALSGEFIRSAANHRDAAGGEQDCPKNRDFFSRTSDLVIMVNPAYEGTRYEALWKAMRSKCIHDDQWPMVITATSTADQATKTFFPLARTFNTIFESDPGDERIANIHTVGHNERYTTHILSRCTEDDPKCNSTCAAAPKSLQAEATDMERTQHLRAESDYIKMKGRMLFGKDDYLCDGLHIKMRPQWQPVGNPFWVMQTTGEIIEDHGDVFNPSFQAFIRQAYLGLRYDMGD